MHKSHKRNKVLRVGSGLLAISLLIVGCSDPVSSPIAPKWLSIDEARSEAIGGKEPTQVLVRGHFERLDQGQFVLLPIKSENGIGMLSEQDYLIVEASNPDTARNIVYCLNEDVVVEGTLVNGDPPRLLAIDMEELKDIRGHKFGKCD